MLLTNQFEPQYDFEAINRDFDIYIVKKDSKGLYKTNILDLPQAEYHARAVQYLWGASAIVLFNKGEASESKFRADLQELYHDVSVLKIDVRNEDDRRKWFKDKNYLLANLLINTLKSPQLEAFSYNNIMGKLYYRDSSWKWKNYIWFLNIYFDYGMLLQLSVNTFMKMPEKSKTGNFLFDAETGSFRKRLKDDDFNGELYKKHSYLKRHNTVDFIKFSDFNQFCKSKLGVMERFLRDVKQKLGSYMKLETVDKRDTEIFRPDKKLSDDSNIRKMLSDYSLNIVDCCDSDTSQEIAVQLVKEFWDRYDVEVQIGSLQKGMLNLRIIHNAEYYMDHSDLTDPHKDDISGFIVQHVTVEDFVDKKGLISKHGFEKIIQELMIKSDNQQKQMSAYDWRDLKLKNDTIFAVRKKIESDNKEMYWQYYVMKIHPDGNFGYDHFGENDYVSTTEREELINAYELLSSTLFRRGCEIECIIGDGLENYTAIGKTKEFTRPDTDKLYDALFQTQPNVTVRKSVLFGYLDEFVEVNEEYRQCAFELKEKLQDADELLTKGQIHKMMNLHSNGYKVLNRWLHSEHNLWIYSEFKSADSGMEMANLTRIQYYPDKWDDDSFYYFVGSKNTAKDRVARACPIRRVTSVVEPFSRKFLFSMLAVDFVRNGQYTVIPFPLKYLREYYAL